MSDVLMPGGWSGAAPSSNIEPGWTPARVAQLSTLWMDGKSATEIMLILGGGITRSAVIGKVHRLKLKDGGSRRMPERPAARKPKVEDDGTPRAPRSIAASKPVGKRGAAGMYRSQGAATRRERLETKADAIVAPAPVVPLREESQAFDATARRLTLIQLTEHTCKWPIGDPAEADFHFCGHDAIDGKPYCEHHGRRAWAVLPPKKKAA